MLLGHPDRDEYYSSINSPDREWAYDDSRSLIAGVEYSSIGTDERYWPKYHYSYLRKRKQGMLASSLISGGCGCGPAVTVYDILNLMTRVE